MESWIWDYDHQKEIPGTVHGTGYAVTNKTEDNTGFELDEKTGLFVPPAAAKDRRKVQIGFVKESE